MNTNKKKMNTDAPEEGIARRKINHRENRRNKFFSAPVLDKKVKMVYLF